MCPCQALGLRTENRPVALYRLIRLLRNLRPDVLQTWMYHADAAGALAGSIAGVPRIVWNIRYLNMQLRAVSAYDEMFGFYVQHKRTRWTDNWCVADRDCMTAPLAKNAAKVAFGHPNHEIQTLATDRDQALTKCVRLRNASRRRSDPSPQAYDRRLPVDRVAIVDNERTCSIPVFPVSGAAVAAACTVPPSAQRHEYRASRGARRQCVPHPTSDSQRIAAISCCRSAGIGGRPGPRDFQRHHNRNPVRCQPMSVSGFTTVSRRRHSRTRDKPTRMMRVASAARRGFTPTYSASYFRRNRFSAASRVRDRVAEDIDETRSQATRTTVPVKMRARSGIT